MKLKQLYRGVFNYHGKVFPLYAYAYTEKQAWLVFCRRIARKLGVPLRVVMHYFSGEKNNYDINIELEVKEIKDEPRTLHGKQKSICAHERRG